jgi:hypothetical protein
MKIEAVDFCYLSIPAVGDIGDGSLDALSLCVRAKENIAYGERKGSPSCAA